MKKSKTDTNFRKKDSSFAVIAMSVAFITLCAFISIPSPFSIPFTLQTLAVFLCSALFGTRRSLSAIAIYIAMGLLGLPVFSMLGSGILVLLKPSGAYLLGFLLCPIIIGSATRTFGQRMCVFLFSMLLSQAVSYLLVIIWSVFILDELSGAYVGFAFYVLPFVIPDILKAILAAYLASKLKKRTDSFLNV